MRPAPAQPAHPGQFAGVNPVGLVLPQHVRGAHEALREELDAAA
ncbi:MAG: hypothetical protein ABIZ81_13295 [Opitutaceae bacterium]